MFFSRKINVITILWITLLFRKKRLNYYCVFKNFELNNICQKKHEISYTDNFFCHKSTKCYTPTLSFCHKSTKCYTPTISFYHKSTKCYKPTLSFCHKSTKFHTPTISFYHKSAKFLTSTKSLRNNSHQQSDNASATWLEFVYELKRKLLPCASHCFPNFNVFIDWRSSHHVPKNL